MSVSVSDANKTIRSRGKMQPLTFRGFFKTVRPIHIYGKNIWVQVPSHQSPCPNKVPSPIKGAVDTKITLELWVKILCESRVRADPDYKSISKYILDSAE